MGAQEMSTCSILPYTLVRGIWNNVTSVPADSKLLGILLDDSGQNVYWANITNPETNTDLRTATYKWTISASGTTEYYLELAAGGDPGLAQPDAVLEGGVWIVEAAVGSLAASEWDYGDNDSLGFSTIYIRLSDGTDPDAGLSGLVRHILGKEKARRVLDAAQFFFDSQSIYIGKIYAYQDTGATAQIKIEIGG